MADEHPDMADDDDGDGGSEGDEFADSFCDASPTDSLKYCFHTTRWSLVLTAGDRQSARQRQALETLCRRYWQPLYCYVRCKGHDVESAEDLIQSYFARLLEKDLLAGVREGRSRFRAFLKTTLNHFINDQWDRNRMQKRQGSREVLSLDLESAEHLYHQLVRTHQLTPDQVYARQWVQTLLDQAWKGLQVAYIRRGRGQVFERLQGFIESEDREDTYRQAAADLGITPAAARACVTRMRRKFRDLMRDVVAETVDDLQQVDEEMSNLWKVFE